MLPFRSKFTIRLYEVVRSIRFAHLEDCRRQYGLDELRTMMGAETYSAYKDFKRRALVTAAEEINRYSGKHVEVEEIKAGRKLVAIEFTIARNETFNT